MMTDQSIRYEYLSVGRTGTENQQLIQTAAAKHKAAGAQWMRVTQVNADHQPSSDDIVGFWLESMTTKPVEEPPFDPPLTAA